MLIFLTGKKTNLYKVWKGVNLFSLATGLTSLYFSYGLLLAVPLALVHTGWIVAIAEVFPESMRGLATGVLMTGGGAGLFLMPPFLDWVIDYFGWRGSYVILGALSLNWVAAAATIFRIGQENNVHNSNTVL